MRTVILLDAELLQTARRLTGLSDSSDVVHAALRALVERETARRLLPLGGRRTGPPDV